MVLGFDLHSFGKSGELVVPGTPYRGNEQRMSLRLEGTSERGGVIPDAADDVRRHQDSHPEASD
jgi:hypothetical protein